MDWFSTNAFDNYSRFVLPMGQSDSEGIDLNAEFHAILYGSTDYPPRSPKGHWVVFRKFNRDVTSEFYNKNTKEGVGGPKNIYTDTITRTRKVDRSGFTALQEVEAGRFITEKYIYYFEPYINPSIGDNLFEIEWPDHTIRPTNVTTLKFTEKFIIKSCNAYRLNNGNVVYWAVNVEYDEVTYG